MTYRTPALEASCSDRWRAHPALDPLVMRTHPEYYRSVYRVYLRVRESEEAYAQFLNRLLHPLERPRSFAANQVTMAYYLNEAARYLDALLALFPRRKRAWLRPRRAIGEERDLRALFETVFNSSDPRAMFEAQRQIYLAKLFLSVAHTWQVQRGEIHRDYFARILERELLRETIAETDVNIAFDIAADGVRINYHAGQPLPNEEVWRFRNRELNFIQDGWPVRVEIFFYSCRSKREVLPYHYVRGQRTYVLQAREKWGDVALRRDASIVSKMLRTGATSPREIPDIVGAMFIVRDARQVEVLKEALFDILGGPMKIRNVVDTLTRDTDHELLNPYSGAGYQVYKADLDLLFPAEWPGGEPYGFTVELQLYTLESYLRTIHTRHYASHQRLKRRQFLEGLVPLLFPVEIFGAPARTGVGGCG